jgi:undecaprenyl diphosphate synthase
MVEDKRRLPRHIAIIMDGNGRWARQNGRRRSTGHRAGVKATRTVVETCVDRGIDILTLFAFSSENWKRPQDEVTGLMSLFLEVLRNEVDSLHENGVRLNFIGDRDQLPRGLRLNLAEAEQKTAGNERMQLVLAVAYGGRWDIVQAAQRVAVAISKGELDANTVDEAVLNKYMSLGGIPDPDLLIRTGGERRVSNFLLWDLAYTELYFTDTLWPEFNSSDLDAALKFFADRERRYGKTGEQVAARTEFSA